MSLVAVTSSKFARGVDSPTHADGTSDWRTESGSAGNMRNVRPLCEVLELTDALGRHYSADAHLVTYVIRGGDGAPLRHQPRVNKGGVDWLASEGYAIDCDVLAVDVDNPGHAPWDDRLRGDLRALLSTPPAAIRSAGVYLTAHGYRLVQPLDEPVVVTEVERYLEGWLTELEAAGLCPDRTCRDWTRLYRLPHVVRSGSPYVSELVDLSRMQPRAITPKAPSGVADRSAAAGEGRAAL